MFAHLFQLLVVAPGASIPWGTVLPLAAVPGSVIGSYLVARRQTPRKVAQTDAARIWDASQALSDARLVDAELWRKRAEECDRRTDELEAQIMALREEVDALKRRVRDNHDPRSKP